MGEILLIVWLYGGFYSVCQNHAMNHPKPSKPVIQDTRLKGGWYKDAYGQWVLPPQIELPE